MTHTSPDLSSNESVSNLTECLYPVWIKANCCAPSYIKVSCKQYDRCVPCANFRRTVIYAKFFDRFNRAYPNLNPLKSRKFKMWTLGTNFNEIKIVGSDVFEKERSDFSRLAKSWKNFRKKLNQHRKRSPNIFSGKFIFYVFETGKAGYHHIHLIADGFLPHYYIRKLWSDSTGIENPNVQFSKKEHTMIYAVNYLLKYMIKEGSRYYWLSDLYKAGATPYEKKSYLCPHCSNVPDSFDFNCGHPPWSEI